MQYNTENNVKAFKRQSFVAFCLLSQVEEPRYWARRFKANRLEGVNLVTLVILCSRLPSSVKDPIESALYKAVSLEFESYSVTSADYSVSNNNSNQLSVPELAKLNELIAANKGFFAPINNIGALLVGDIKVSHRYCYTKYQLASTSQYLLV